MQVNWIDLIIVVFVLLQVYEGWERGFISLAINLGSFLASLWLAIRFHAPVGSFIIEKFGLATTWANVMGYVVVALISQVLLEELFHRCLRTLPNKLHTSKINHQLGVLVSMLNALIIVSFFLLLILALPFRGSIKADIRKSEIGSRLVYLSEQYGGQVRSTVEEAAKGALKFLTVQPESREVIPLHLPEAGLSFRIDSVTEREMVDLVNKERTSRGVSALSFDAAITEVARGKSRDMFERRYFSHYDPDGKNAADRMNEARINYTLVGENLAYAPDLASAHQGLMGSEGHRTNILEGRFHRIGIGVIDGGIHGKMFTQIFAD